MKYNDIVGPVEMGNRTWLMYDCMRCESVWATEDTDGEPNPVLPCPTCQGKRPIV